MEQMHASFHDLVPNYIHGSHRKYGKAGTAIRDDKRRGRRLIGEYGRRKVTRDLKLLKTSL